MGGNYSVAIDLGGTIIKIGLILDSEIVRFTTISSDSVKGLSHMLPKMEHAIDSLLSEEGISSTDLASIGLAFPGMVNPVECRVISTNDKYDDACDIDLCHWADSRWGVSFVLENDARLAVMNWNPMKQDSASTMAFLPNWKSMECSRWSRSITMSCRLHGP